MENKLKLCRDFKYCKVNGFSSYAFAKCEHPSLEKRIDPVTGDKVPHFADSQRRSYAECGEKAKLFEPRPSIWERSLRN